MFEAKINFINKTGFGYRIVASLFRTNGPLINPDGSQFYDRTLIAQDDRLVPLGTTKTQIINFLKNKMDQLNTTRNLGFTLADFYVIIDAVTL